MRRLIDCISNSRLRNLAGRDIIEGLGMRLSGGTGLKTGNMDRWIFRTWRIRYALEQFLIVSVAITPLVVTLRYYWGGAVFAVAALPLGLLLLFPDIRDELRASWRRVAITPAIIFAALLATWAIVSFLWSWTPHRSWHGFTKTAGYIIFAVFAAGVFRTIERNRIFRPLITFTVCGAFLGIFTALSNGAAYRAVGCCEDGGIQPILSGCAVVTAILIWPCVGWLVQRGNRTFCVFMLLVSLIVVLVSQNASAKMMWGAGFTSIVLSYRLPRLTLVMPTIIACVGFLTAPFLSSIYSAFEGIIVVVWRFYPESRALIWSYFDMLFWQRPWTGFGLRSEQIIGDPGRFSGLYPPPYASSHTHNMALNVLFDFGIVGGALALAAIAALTYRLFHADRPERYRYGIAVATAYLFGTLVNYGLWEWWLMTVMLLAFVLCRRLLQDDSNDLA